jgi:hypothetical protein
MPNPNEETTTVRETVTEPTKPPPTTTITETVTKPEPESK